MPSSDASKNVAENVPRLILLAMLASVSFIPCFVSRSASSRYPISAPRQFGLQEPPSPVPPKSGAAWVRRHNCSPVCRSISTIYDIFRLTAIPHNDMLLPYTGDRAMLDVRGDNRQLRGLEIAATAKILAKRQGVAGPKPKCRQGAATRSWLDPHEPHCTCPDHRGRRLQVQAHLRSRVRRSA